MPRVGFNDRLVEDPLKGLLMRFCNVFLAGMNMREKEALKESLVKVVGSHLVAILQQISE